MTHFDTKYGNMEKKEDNFALKQRKSQLILYTRREEAKKKKKKKITIHHQTHFYIKVNKSKRMHRRELIKLGLFSFCMYS